MSCEKNAIIFYYTFQTIEIIARNTCKLFRHIAYLCNETLQTPNVAQERQRREALFESHFLSADLPIIMEFQPKDDNH